MDEDREEVWSKSAIISWRNTVYVLEVLISSVKRNLWSYIWNLAIDIGHEFVITYSFSVCGIYGFFYIPVKVFSWIPFRNELFSEKSQLWVFFWVFWVTTKLFAMKTHFVDNLYPSNYSGPRIMEIERKLEREREREREIFRISWEREIFEFLVGN
jgi:hypothetical protein